MATMRINLELSAKQAAALRRSLQLMYRQRMQDQFWQERYSRIPHGMRVGSIVADCPDMAASVKLLDALQAAEQGSTAGGER